jgi:hypothetical protein
MYTFLVLFIVLLHANKSGIEIITSTQIIFFSTKEQVRAAPEQDEFNLTQHINGQILVA